MLTIPLHLGSKPWRFAAFAWSLRLTDLSERRKDTPNQQETACHSRRPTFTPL